MDDDVVGDEVAQARDVEVVGLFFADVLDRLDFVPPDVGVAELFEGGGGGRRRQLGDQSARGSSACRRASCELRGRPVSSLTAGPDPVALGQQHVIPDLGGSVSVLVERGAASRRARTSACSASLPGTRTSSQNRRRLSCEVILISRATLPVPS